MLAAIAVNAQLTVIMNPPGADARAHRTAEGAILAEKNFLRAKTHEQAKASQTRYAFTIEQFSLSLWWRGACWSLGNFMTWLALAYLVACGGSDTDTDAELPAMESETPDPDTDLSNFPIESGLDTDPTEVSPDHTVTVRQWGVWNRTPEGGPHVAFTGTLWVQEYYDGWRPEVDTDTDVDTDPPEDSDTDAPLACDLEIALTGAVSASATCSGCDAAFDVSLTLVTGDPSGCRDPQALQVAEIYRFAYATEGQIQLDYGDLGLWLPWYTATAEGDRVSFEWEGTFGVALEEEEEE